MSEVSGRMTDSWNPSSAIRREAVVSFPHVAVDTVVYQFRDYYQEPAHNMVRTRGEWDRKFLSWCARREGAWFSDHHHADEEEKWDPVTGMAKKPKPIKYAPKEEKS